VAHALVVTQTPDGQDAPAGQASTCVQVQRGLPGDPVAVVLPAALWQSVAVV
jgi:hypothetical protein